MSFEIFVQTFGDMERTGMSRAAVRELFPVVGEESETDAWRVRYDELNSCDILVTPMGSDRESIKSLCIWKPCADPKLFVALLQVLGMGSVFAYWPGSPPVVADDGVASSLPKPVTDALGPARCVGSVEDWFRLSEET